MAEKKYEAFAILDDHPDRAAFEVRVFRRRRDMVRWIEKMKKKHPKLGMADTSRSLAVCLPVWNEHHSWDGRLVRSQRVGYLAFNRKHVRPAIVVHELLHAAVHLYRLRDPYDEANLGERSRDDREERLAHSLDELWHFINNELHERGIWK